jgi:hypothetical protein
MLAGSIDLTTKVTGLLPDGNISSAATWNAKQAALNGTGFVKASGTTISYDNSTYLTTSAASSTYLPLAGGTLTGPLNGTKFAFSISSNSDWAGSIDNLGTTGANGLYVNIGASSTGTPFAVYKNFSQLFKVANDGAATFSSSVQADGSGNGFLINQNGGASGLATYSVNTDKAQIAFKYAQNYPASNNYTRVLDIVSTGDATGGGMIRLFTTVNNSTPSAALILSSTGAATFSSTLQVNGSQSYFGSTKGFIYFVEDQINCYYSSNAAATLAVNYYGYNQGLTQFRSFDVYNGKGTKILGLDGSTGVSTFTVSGNDTRLANFSSSTYGSARGLRINSYTSSNGGQDCGVEFDSGVGGYGGFKFSNSGTPMLTLLATGTATFSGQVNGSSGAAFSGQVTAGGYTASGDFGTGYTINGAIGISGKGVNIGWNTTNDCGFIGTVHNGTAWKSLALVPVAGALLVGTTVAATGLLQVSGTVYATGFYESSDIRFKNILATNPNVNVSGIDVIKFTRKDKDIDQVRFGYSAQQVQSILPDVVTGNEFLNVNYLDVHTLKIAALEQRIKELENK